MSWSELKRYVAEKSGENVKVPRWQRKKLKSKGVFRRDRPPILPKSVGRKAVRRPLRSILTGRDL